MFWIVVIVITAFRCSFTSSQSFVTQPSSSFHVKNGDVTFTCQVSGLMNVTYLWLKDGVSVTRGTSAVTNSKAVLTIIRLQFQDAGQYACRAQGTTKSITSNSAVLTIQGTPDITHPPSSISPHVGQVAMFTCVAIGNPVPVITWYYNMVNTIVSGRRYSIFSNGTLFISNLMKSDAGQYMCKPKNIYGDTSAFVDLIVLDPPSVPHFTTTPQNKTAKEDSEITFYCEATGSPTPSINWTRIGGVMQKNRQSQPRPGALRLVQLVPTDDGTYACVAKNSQGEKIKIAYLRIEGFPKFTVTPSDVEVKENEPIRFDCIATSDPIATIQWLLPNGNIITSLSMPLGSPRVLANNTLVIDGVSENQEGVYKCIAKNSVGSKEHKVKLSVLTVPRFQTQLQNITKTRDQDLTVTCAARGNPTPEVQWIFGGKIIRRLQTLHMTGLNVSNQGSYVCRANNTMGVLTGTFFLRVVVPPVITTAPTNQTIGNGGAASFICQSQGDPTPAITWYKSAVLVQSNARYSILLNGTLSIAMATEGDKGWFSCRAENSAGFVEKKAYLVVTDLPKFTRLPSNKTAKATENVILQCKAVAQDNPVITWYKIDDSGLRHKVASAVTLVSGDLNFASVTRSDRSMYACQACNAAGCRTTAQVMLNVLYHPSFLVPPENVGVLQGQDAVLKCEPDSNPTATITWRRPNGAIIEGTGYEQRIPNVRPGDTGEYTCKASNSYGQAGPVGIRLDIETKAVITDLEGQRDSSHIIVTCKVQGIPAPQVAWYLGQETLPQNAKYPDYSITLDNKLRVPIGSLETKTFVCNASNTQSREVYYAKVPVPPTSVSTTEITSQSLQVTWVRPSPPEIFVTHYILEICSAELSWKTLDDDIKNLWYPVSQLSAYTTYMFRVRAANGLGVSGYSMTSGKVITLSSSPSVPQNLSLAVRSAKEIKVTWAVPKSLHGPIENLEYRVMYHPKSPNFTNEFDYAHKNVSAQHFTLGDLEADMYYTIRVRAWRLGNDGTNLTSSYVTASARTLQIVPSLPINLVIVPNGPNQILTKWKKPPYSISGYNIWYKENKPGLTHTKVTIPNGSATTYVIMDLKEDTEYQVKVQIYSNVGEGPFTEPLTVRTKTDAFSATYSQSQGSSSLSWKVAVGGLACGIILLLVVAAIVWCWRKRTQQSNQTFRVTTRRRRTASDINPSSNGSEGSTQGRYNIGSFNPELDNDLDLGMFSGDGNVIPVSATARDENVLEFTNPKYTIYEVPRGTNEVPRGTNEVPRGGEVLRGTKADQNHPIYASVETHRPSDNGNSSGNLTVNADIIINKDEQNTNDDTDETQQRDFDPRKPESGIPVYAQVDMSKKQRKSSKDDDLERFPKRENLTVMDDDDLDISDVPFPDEDCPRMERTMTNVSEFNFPPPPGVPPSGHEHEELNSDGSSEDDPSDFSAPYGGALAPPDQGPKKRRMVASWADTDEEPMGNLWEAVDKELDRRLGTT